MSSNLTNSFNIAATKNAYDSKIVKGAFLPSVYVLEPISHCNLSCVMCPNSKLNADKLGHMELYDFESVLSKISPFAELTMLYFMGEPLQHPDFIALVKLAREKLKGKIVISTNCMLLTSDISNDLIEIGIDVIICCIDHWSKKKYEKIRIGGKFETVVKNVETLLEIKAKHPYSNTEIIVKSLDFGFEDEEMNNFETYWASQGGIPLIGWVDSWAGQFPELRKLDSQPQPYSKSKRIPCADLWFKMVINWKGDVVLCCHNYDYSIVFGNIITDDLQVIWNSEKIVQFRNSHINKQFNCNTLCAGCTEWGTLQELDTYAGLMKENFNLVF